MIVFSLIMTIILVKLKDGKDNQDKKGIKMHEGGDSESSIDL